ncbi:MAG: hypothetical protein V7686_04285 [Qipengyuania sp.]
MISLTSEIAQIEALLSAGDAKSVVYAALEARLALEKICYDRLRQHHDYIAYADLRKWQPAKVMNQLIEEVDSAAAYTRVISISKTPHREDQRLDDADFIQIGEEVGFPPALIAKLWNSLSNLALHVRLPRSRKDQIPAYPDPAKVGDKVREALAEIKRISASTVTMSGLGAEVTFECECGKANKRRADLLREGQVVSCANFECNWSWVVRLEGDQINFQRQGVDVSCKDCGHEDALPWREIEKLRIGQVANWDCPECNGKNLVALQLYQARNRKA